MKVIILRFNLYSLHETEYHAYVFSENFVVHVRLKLNLEKVTKIVRKRELIGWVERKTFRSEE